MSRKATGSGRGPHGPDGRTATREWGLTVAVRADLAARTGLAEAARRMSRARTGRQGRGDDGDVPGWVLVTLMTAGLVATVYAFTKERLEGLLDDAFSDVLSGGD